MEDMENPHVYLVGNLIKMDFHVSVLELSNC